MRALPVLIGAGLVLGALIMTIRKVSAAEIEASLDPLFEKWGRRYGVDPLLLKAHAIVESDLDAQAVNPFDPSYGLMQVLCTRGPNGRCANTFNVDGWAGMTAERLKNPDVNIMIAAQIVAYNVRTFGMPRAVAVYNRWAERLSPPGGPFGNQGYVDKVLAEYERLKADA